MIQRLKWPSGEHLVVCHESDIPVLGDLVRYSDHQAAIAARDAVIRELVAANLRARQPGHVSDVMRAIEQRDKIEAKALALIGGEKGEGL